MRCYRICKSTLAGEIAIPSSKSHTLRAILFGAMGTGKSIVRAPLFSSDAAMMIEACRLLGSDIAIQPQQLDITGTSGPAAAIEDVIQAGNSGIVLRFISAIAALSGHYAVITGDASIRHQRPMKPLVSALEQLGAEVISTRGDGFAPFIVRGPLKPGLATLSGEDSQPVSALLIAAAFIDGVTEVRVTNPGEKPWILLTLDWFDRLGIRYENRDFEHYRIFGKCSYSGFDYTVPGDFSSAAFPLVAALITGSEITLHNIDMHDPQGDKQLVYLLQEMGANIEIDEKSKSLLVKRGGKLIGKNIDINTFIDALPIVAVLACYAEGTTQISNAAAARGKESNRLHSISTELKKMGADIIELDDGLIIKKSILKGAHMYSHHDHRIAMSLMVASLAAEGESVIDHVECVMKTFPNVAEEFQTLGADIKVQDQ